MHVVADEVYTITVTAINTKYDYLLRNTKTSLAMI